MNRDTDYFDLVLSFAGPDRLVARDLANNLKSRGLRVFFDEDFQYKLLGANLPEVLARIFRDHGLFCIMLVSQSYAQRPYPTLERRAAFDRMLADMDREYILPIRLDDTWVDGLPQSTAYLDLRQHGVAGVSNIVAQKVSSHRAENPAASPRGEGPGAPLWRGLGPGISLPNWVLRFQISRFRRSTRLKMFLRLLQRAEMGGAELVAPLLKQLQCVLHPESWSGVDRDFDYNSKVRVIRLFIVEMFFAFRQGPVNNLTTEMILKDPLDYDDFIPRFLWYAHDRFLEEYFRSFVSAGHVTDDSFYNILKLCAVLIRGKDREGKEVLDLIAEYTRAQQWGYRRHAVYCTKMRWEAKREVDDGLVSRIGEMGDSDPDPMVSSEAASLYAKIRGAQPAGGAYVSPAAGDPSAHL